MGKDFTAYLPYIAAAILVASGIAIYERGGFEKGDVIRQLLSSPTPAATTLPGPNTPLNTPSPLQTMPSIRGGGGEGENDF